MRKFEKKTLTSLAGDCDGYKNSILCDLPKYGVAVYEFNGLKLDNKKELN